MIKVPNIAAVSDLESAGKRIYNRIHLIQEEDVDLSAGEPEITVSDAARTMGALKLKEGAAIAHFDFAKFTAAATSQGSNGDVTTETTNSLTGTLAGDRIEIDNFIENFHGKPFFIVVSDRINSKQYIYGRPRCPYYFTDHDKKKNSDNSSCDVTFSSPFPFQPLEYLGSVEGAPAAE
ncbi:MAG: hypothetical protein ACI3Z0_03140 [Candidatus Cryptobacteroides sp.]